MISYQLESIQDCLEEITPLTKLHYEELNVTPKWEVKPDWNSYFLMEKGGMFKMYTAREDDILIGYIFVIVSNALHYTDCLTAHEDVYFLLPKYRKGWVGVQMFKFFEKSMKELGVDRIICSTKIHKDNSSLFKYLGYSPIETLFAKVL